MRLRSIEEAGDLKGKRVLVRAGFDFDLDEGEVPDDFRMRAVIPTMKFILARGGSLIVIAHEGRPKGSVVSQMSQQPLVPILSELLGTKVTFMSSSTGTDVRAAAKVLNSGDVLLLENLRFDSREEENDNGFSKELASLADLYVNEAFANIHRPHASIIGIPKFLPAYAGLQVVKEIAVLEEALSPMHPAIALIGGAKFETKVPLMTRLIETYDELCVAGALANDFFKVNGHETGISRISEELPSGPLITNPKLSLPVDIVTEKGEESRTAHISDVHPDERIADIGPDTIALWQEKIRHAKFVLWNGNVGIYERGFFTGDRAIAEIIKKTGVRAVIGGGNTLASLRGIAFDEEKVFLSTGGGAMLEFLAKGTLPGLEPLKRRG